MPHDPWRMFLNPCRLPERGPDGDVMASRRDGLTVLMVRGNGVSFRWVSLSQPSLLLRESCHP